MKVTRYEQSCLLIEIGKTRILIDPGTPFTDKHDIDELGELDAVFITHEHADHFDKDFCEELAKATKIHVNESTDKLLKHPDKIVIKDNDLVEIGKVKIKVRELPHCLMPDGREGPQNIGYLVDDKLFHPGDGVDIKGLKVENLALPIIGPDVSPKDAFQFAREVQAKKAIAIHYDIFGANPDVYKMFAERNDQPFELIALKPGESIKL